MRLRAVHVGRCCPYQLQVAGDRGTQLRSPYNLKAERVPLPAQNSKEAKMTRATKILELVLWTMLWVGSFAYAVYWVGWLYLENDEVADCKLRQFMAGGKKPAAMDLASNIIYTIEKNNVVVDFRKLDKHWSYMCLTSLYQPNAPYISDRESHWGRSARVRNMGCWRGDGPANLTMLLMNRHIEENEDQYSRFEYHPLPDHRFEYHRIPVPHQLREPTEGLVLETNYRIHSLGGNFYQCSEVKTAVATCLRHEHADDKYCLLVFRR